MEVVLQAETGSGYRCQGFSSIPVVWPALITIAHAGSSTSQRWANQLLQETSNSLLSLSAGASGVTPPCGGYVAGANRCHAHVAVDCRKLLILVGDASTPIARHQAIDTWLNGDSSYRIVPVFPTGANPSLLLPPSLSTTNAIFWQRTIAEVVPHIFAAVGLTVADFRIFVSYNRQDTEKLCDQLYAALTQENFDVYVDRFRTPPGINFQLHLEQELLDKAMVVVLESPRIATSHWCQYEIAYAKKHRLGLLGVQLPRGPSLPDIAPAFREALRPGDFVDPAAPQELTLPALARVVDRIKREHGRALLYQRQYLRDSMQDALTLENISGAMLGADGLLRVHSPGPRARPYALWLTIRCPALPDFQVTDTALTGVEKGIVIGPGAVDKGREGQIQWLVRKSDVACFDVSQMLDVAERIRRELL